MYINETIPKSNKEAHTHYYLVVEGFGIKRADTLDDISHIVQQAKFLNSHIKKAVRVSYGIPKDFTPETNSERDERHNREHCQAIAEEMEKYIDGQILECPECFSTLEIPEDGGEKFKCPHCSEVFDREDARQMDIGDYLADILDIDYIVNYQKKYKACRILVAYGGPNIYLDTYSGCVELYWWTDSAKYRMRSDTIDALDEWAKDYYDGI